MISLKKNLLKFFKPKKERKNETNCQENLENTKLRDEHQKKKEKSHKLRENDEPHLKNFFKKQTTVKQHKNSNSSKRKKLKGIFKWKKEAATPKEIFNHGETK